jgi:lysozyme family protein
MKKNFHKCFEMLLAHEGGFVNHPEDPGGATNLGVTKRTLQGYLGRHVSMDEMRNLTPEDVKPIYRKNYADSVCFDDLPRGLDWAMLDWAVNSGAVRAAKALQKIVGAKQDGVIGPKTLKAVANYEAAETIGKLHDSRQRFCEGLSHFMTFGRGWTHRNKQTLKAAIEMF